MQFTSVRKLKPSVTDGRFVAIFGIEKKTTTEVHLNEANKRKNSCNFGDTSPEITSDGLSCFFSSVKPHKRFKKKKIKLVTRRQLLNAKGKELYLAANTAQVWIKHH